MVLEDTSEGLLCSQGSSATAGHTPCGAASPQCKRRRPLEEEEEQDEEGEGLPAAVGSWGPTTVLTCCSQQGPLYTVLVAVVHPSHLKEVKVGESNNTKETENNYRHEINSFLINET